MDCGPVRKPRNEGKMSQACDRQMPAGCRVRSMRFRHKGARVAR